MARSAWLAVNAQLGKPVKELPGCRCNGDWEDFRKVLNWTLAQTPRHYKAAPFGVPKRASWLCHGLATPLVKRSLGGRSLGAIVRSANTSRLLVAHTCPAGLVTALALCAAVHSGETTEDLPSPNDSGANVLAIDWKAALTVWPSWPQLLPEGCHLLVACFALIEALLAASALEYAAHCLDHSLWPVDVSEVQGNALRWLQTAAPHLPKIGPLPRWRGPSAAARVRRLPSLVAVGAFAIRHHLPSLPTMGPASLIEAVAGLWEHEAAMTPSQSAGALARTFAAVRSPRKIGTRGPVSVNFRVHEDDFKGARAKLRFYVYDLPNAAHSDLLVVLHGKMRESTSAPSNCDFGLSACTELRGCAGAFAKYRPYAAEVAFLSKLANAPENVIVDDAQHANYFLVPFLSSTWCFLGAPTCWVKCGGLRPLDALMPLLEYYNSSTSHRHLFLASDSTGNLPVDLQRQPLSLTYGPSACDIGTGALIAPPPVTDELPVPSSATFSGKDLFLFAVDGVGLRPYREEAISELQNWQRRLPHLFIVSRRGDAGGGASEEDCGTEPMRSPAILAEWALAMKRAVFCPVLPGDNTFRIRFFHALLVGCIPVMVAFPGGGWYRAWGPTPEQSLPFASRIAWRNLVVELPYDPRLETFRDWSKRLVPQLLRMDIMKVRARQRQIAASAQFLRYDHQGNRPDAFTALLDELVVRAKASPEVSVECFDPRVRFDTTRLVSGVRTVEAEEREIFGVVACCSVSSSPLWVDGAAGTARPKRDEPPVDKVMAQVMQHLGASA